MGARGCHVPLLIRLRGLPDEERLGQMSDAIASTVAGRLAEADRIIAVREGWHSWRKSYDAPEIDFGAAEFDDDLRRRITAAVEAGIARALSGSPAAARQAPPVVPAQFRQPEKKPAIVPQPVAKPSPVARKLPVRRAAPAKKKAVEAPWRVRFEVPFHVKPRRFFEIRARYFTARNRPDEVDPMEVYYPLLDTRRPAVAWVVEVQREYDFYALSGEVLRSFGAKRSKEEYIWSIAGWGSVRQDLVDADEDHVLGHRVPEFASRGFIEQRPGDPGPQIILRPGAWIITGFLPLPLIRLTDVVEIGERQWTDLAFRDAGGIVTPEDFAAEFGLKWTEVERGAPGSTVTIAVEPFTVRRKVHQRTLDALFGQHRKVEFATRLGRVVLRADNALQVLPPRLQAFLASLPDKEPSRHPAGIDDAEFWQAGARGANLTLFFPDDLADQVLLGLNAAFLAAEADEVQRVLAMENTFWNADRNQALGEFIDRWRNRDARLFGLLLSMLERLGKLDAFLDAVRALSSLDAYRWRTVIALAAKTRYAQHPGILALVRQQEALLHSLEAFHYDIDAQEVWIDGDQSKRLRAAGDSSDDKAGVVAEVVPYYSESARIYQPGPEALDRLSAPTRKKVGEFMARTVCAPGETMTREQLMKRAIQEAAKELTPPLEEKDFVKVTMRNSIRVLKLEPRVTRGYTETYVHFQEVRKIGDQPWEPSGELRIASAIAFEARLRYYHVQHEMEALTVFFLAQTVLYGGLLVIELGIATVGQLIFFVSIQLVIYRFTTDAEDRTLEGYLVSALKGELDAVGFKLISGFVKGAGQLVASRLISSELVSEVATKWIVFTMRGLLTGVGVGGLEVTSLFAEDLLRWSHCKGWSSPGQYWDRFKYGFWATLAFEFVAVPFLGPPLRLALEKASNAIEAARVLRATGKSLREITTLLLEGGEKLDAALGRAIDRKDVLAAMSQSLWQRVWGLAKTVGREYESRAYRSLLELYEPELGAEAARGLRRLLAVASEGEIDQLLQRLLAQRASASDLFRALGGVEEKTLADLVKAGQLARLGTSRRLLALLTQDPAVGSKLLAGPFKSAVGDLERYLGHLEELTPQTRDSVIRALIEEHPLAPDILLGAARQAGVLDEPTLALLRQLRDARIRIEAFFDGSGPTLKAFADDFAKLSEGERAFALQQAAGRPPAPILAQAAKARVELKAVAEEVEPTPERLREELKAGTRGEARARVRSQQRTGRYQTTILNTVLKKNARELARMRKALQAFAPDAIVGAERGGPFVADAATFGDPQLAGRIVRIPSGSGEAVMQQMRDEIEKLIAKGKRRFAFTEVFFSGSAVQKLQKDVIKPLAGLHPECQFKGFWLREELGFETIEDVAASGKRPALVPDPRAPSNVKSEVFDVPFAVGDDAARIIESTTPEPIYIFDAEGRIVEMINPRPDEKTTREVVIRILGEGGD